MESNQIQSPNGSPAAGKPVTEGQGTDKLNRNLTGVVDHFFNAINDHILNVESAVRENTAQLRVMASSIELVREIPEKMERVEKGLATVVGRQEMCMDSLGKLYERIVKFEQSTTHTLTVRLSALEWSVQQLAAKPAEWRDEMNGLREALRKHAELFEKPQEKRVYHRHYLHYYGWVILGVSVALGVFAILYRNAREDAQRSSGNDLLWRGAWQMPDSTIHEQLMRLKTQNDTNSEQFRRQVLEDEAQDEELTQKLKEETIRRKEAEEKSAEATEKQQEANQAGREADELKKQKKKH